MIYAGLWGATLSSAIGALLSAPRTMQALAHDRVIPRFMGRGAGAGDDPRIATGVSFCIAALAVSLGDLNLIAPVLTMFTLMTYGLLNVSAAVETLLGSPSWRSTFRVPWIVSLLGTLSCFIVMFLINAGATFVAALFSAATFYFIKKRSLNIHWDDTRHGIFSHLAQYAIFQLDETPPNERTWRPNILVFSGNPATRWHLVSLADAMSHGKGLMTVATILSPSDAGPDHIVKLNTTIKEYLKERGVPALVRVHTHEDVFEGIRSLVRFYGLGPIIPNTVMLGQSAQQERFKQFVSLIRLCQELK